MRIDQLRYREVKGVVVGTWRCDSLVRPDYNIHGEDWTIYSDGTIEARDGFLWDFGTGAIDTPAMIVASLAHDIGCIAIQEGKLSAHWQPVVDRMLQMVYMEVDIDLGRFKWIKKPLRRLRSKWVYKAVRTYQDHKHKTGHTLDEMHPVKHIP